MVLLNVNISFDISMKLSSISSTQFCLEMLTTNKGNPEHSTSTHKARKTFWSFNASVFPRVQDRLSFKLVQKSFPESARSRTRELFLATSDRTTRQQCGNYAMAEQHNQWISSPSCDGQLLVIIFHVCRCSESSDNPWAAVKHQNNLLVFSPEFCRQSGPVTTELFTRKRQNSVIRSKSSMMAE